MKPVKDKTRKLANGRWLEVCWHRGRKCWMACISEGNRGRWIFAYTRALLFVEVRRQINQGFASIPVELWARGRV